jgi:hypothetical protein
MIVSRRVEGLSGAMVESVTGVERAKRISALNMDQRLMVVTASKTMT